MQNPLCNKMETTDDDPLRKSRRQAKKAAEIGRILVKEEVKARVKQVSDILKKKECERTEDEKTVLQQSPEIVSSISKRAKSRDAAKQRLLEVEDEPGVLESKCDELAIAIRNCKRVVVYTGAGISTAASIPDYRGPNGVWTLLQQGKEIKAQELSDAEPTLTHMAIAKLHHENIVKHVVSQNCDGLHLRSGLPRAALSEVHGNMFIEMCKECSPPREYIRLFDVTERTGVRRHSTGRECLLCHSQLKDTIVHFGEKGGLQSPYNWQEAADAVDDCDMILCLGSSLKILRKYACLWCMDMRPKDRPKLFIVNLQWTPKDDFATLKINGRCDTVMKYIMEKLDLEIPDYRRAADPLFKMATQLLKSELDSTSKKILVMPEIIEPNQFSHAANYLLKRNKMNKKKALPASKVYKTIKSLLDGETGAVDHSPDMNHTDSSGSSGAQDGVKLGPDKVLPNLPFSAEDRLTHNTHIGIKSEILHKSSTGGISLSGEFQEPTNTGKLRETSEEPARSVQSPVPNTVILKPEDLSVVKNQWIEINENKESESEYNSDVIKSEMNNVSVTPPSPVNTLPGWFGKGFNPRKRKRRL